jgi:hypothetical protein
MMKRNRVLKLERDRQLSLKKSIAVQSALETINEI